MKKMGTPHCYYYNHYYCHCFVIVIVIKGKIVLNDAIPRISRYDSDNWINKVQGTSDNENKLAVSYLDFEIKIR